MTNITRLAEFSSYYGADLVASKSVIYREGKLSLLRTSGAPYIILISFLFYSFLNVNISVLPTLLP